MTALVLGAHKILREPPMERALREAEAAAVRGEVPVGAVIVEITTGVSLAAAGNQVEALADPTAHAELLAIRRACAARGQPRLPECDLYVTLEPCAMCAAAISFARLRRVYFGAYDPKGGNIEHGARWFKQKTCHHVPDVYGGFYEIRCQTLLRDFFQGLR
ncbi:tRNA-specific adenosine deaminase [Azospirillaceae bacterium]